MKTLSRLISIILISYFSLSFTNAWCGKNKKPSIEQSIAQASHFEDVRRICDEANQEGLLNHNIVASYLFAAARAHERTPEQLTRVHEFFMLATRLGLINTRILTNYIFLAGRATDMRIEKARKAFDMALEDESLMDSNIITNYMLAAIAAGNLAEVNRAFEEAKKRRLLNEAILINYIFAVRELGDDDELTTALATLKELDPSLFENIDGALDDDETTDAAAGNAAITVTTPTNHPRIRRRINLQYIIALPQTVRPRGIVTRLRPRIDLNTREAADQEAAAGAAAGNPESY